MSSFARSLGRRIERRVAIQGSRRAVLDVSRLYPLPKKSFSDKGYTHLLN